MKLNLLPLLRQLRIFDKRMGFIRFEPNWAQIELIHEVERQYNAGRPVRIIVNKARQLGVSTVAEAILFWWGFIHPGANQLVLAHQTGSARELFEKTKLFWDAWVYKDHWKLSSTTQHRMVWDHHSSMKIATARTTEGARGQTLHGVHASEVGFWEDPDTLMVALSQAVPSVHKTIMILESTANGVGNYFHTAWTDAEVGDTDYSPLFFPWWKHYEYRASYDNRNDLIDLVTSLDREERRLVKEFGVDDDQLAWRRHTLANKCNSDPDFFKQEYPSTAEEAFLTSGRAVFPADALNDCKAIQEPLRGFLTRTGPDAVEFIPDITGPLYVYKAPNLEDPNFAPYYVAGDPTHAVHDRACIQVLNRRNWEQVATWHGKVDPVTFADELVKVAIYYNMAGLSCEIEGPGYATIGRLMEMNYPNIWRDQRPDRFPSQGHARKPLGWSSTWKRKEWAVNVTRKMVLDRIITIHDSETYRQMRDWTQLDSGTFGPYGPADPKGFDDACMAMVICCICASTEPPLAPWEPARTRENQPQGMWVDGKFSEVTFGEKPVWESWSMEDAT